MAEVVDTAQKPHHRAELRAKASALHSRWQLGADCRVAMRADQPMQLVLNRACRFPVRIGDSGR